MVGVIAAIVRPQCLQVTAAAEISLAQKRQRLNCSWETTGAFISAHLPLEASRRSQKVYTFVK
jgi:hypothetical protein